MSEQSGVPVAVVTGASQGLGQAMSLALAAAGYRLLLVARRVEPLRRLQAQIQTAGGEASPLAVDVRNPVAVEMMARQLQEHYGRIDLLVNNAGLMGGELAFDALSASLWERVLETNLTGPFLCCRALLPLMRRQGQGCIVNISSGAAVRTGFLNTAYGVSKAGLDRLTLGLAAEFEAEGLACVSLSPPVSATETVRELYADQAVDEWAAAPELTARALLRLLEIGPRHYNGKVVSARELLNEQ